MCCCAKLIIKYVLIVANLVFTLAGLALVIVGVIALVHLSGVFELFPSFIESIPIVVTSVGGVIFLVSFFGCCGAMRESRCLLYMYMICMLALIGSKIWLASIIFMNLNNLQSWVTGWITEAFNMNNPLAFDTLQNVFRCCGTTGYNSYGPNPLPDSCCANIFEQCNSANAFPGCNELVGDYFESFGAIIGSIIVVVIAIEVVAVVFALFIALYPKNKSSHVN